MKEMGDIPLLDFEHLEPHMFENIADPEQQQSFMDVLRKIPLELSVPIVMQVILRTSVAETADYLNISKQAVYKKNKCFINIFKTYPF